MPEEAPQTNPHSPPQARWVSVQSAAWSTRRAQPARAELPTPDSEEPEDYVLTAAALAADPGRRRLLRHGLRDMIRANPLGQPDRFVRAFYAKAEEVARA
jgi:hypothetical protein